ncbi:winged helix-turn-helix domain-containing protein, partial [bacterium]
MMMGQTMVALATGVLVLVTAVGGEAAPPPDFWEMVLQSPDVPATGAVKPYAGFPGQPVQCSPHAGCPFPDFEHVGPMTPPCRPQVVARLLALTDDQKKALARNAGQVLSRNEIHRTIYNRDYNGFDRSIDMYISRLRHKLGDDQLPPRFLKT